MVAPDASDFASALDEQIGGLSASVSVTPDASDFASAVDEQTGGLTATVTLLADPQGAADFGDAVSEQSGTLTVPVTAVPDVSDFGDMLADETSGTVVPVTVVPDAPDFQERLDDEVGTPVVTASVQAGGLADLGEHLATAAGGTVPVTVVPDVANFQDALDEETGGLTVDAKVTPDVSSLQDAIDDAAGQAVITIPVDADVSPAVASLADLEEQAADDSGIQTLYNGILSIGAVATQAEMEAVDAMTSIGGTAASVGAQVGEIGDSASSAGAEASGAFTQAGEAASAADSGIETFLGGIYSIGPAAGEMGSMVADAMGNARQAVADTASAFGSVDYSAASEGLASVGGAADDVARAAPVASDAASGLSGVLGMLGERLSYMAVDPFMWMYAAPVVIEGVAAAVRDLSSASSGYIGMLAKQDDAAGYNISGYQKLADQLGQTAQAYAASGQAAEDSAGQFGRAGQAASGFGAISQEMTAAQQQEASEADNLTTHLGTLEQAYGLTQTQAEQLASAAGVSASQLTGSGSAANAAMAKIEAYAQSNLTAAGAVRQLATDQETFSNDTLTATSRISALDNAYTTLAGNFVSEQQAQLTVEQGFNAISLNAEATGASMKGVNDQSIALQQSFYGQASAIEQAANAMVQNGDSTQQVTSYIDDQIGKLSTYTGGSKNASEAVQDLKKWEDSLTGSLQAQGSYLSTTLSNDLDAAILKYSGVQTAVTNYAQALVDFGPKSQQAQSAQELMNDAIVKGGVAAGQTQTQIAQMIAEQDKIPLKEAIQIVLNAEGQYNITDTTVVGGGSTPSSGGQRITNQAYGGLITGGSGQPRADDVHAMLSHGEYVVQAPAVDHYGVGLLDAINARRYASGGLVSGSYSGTGPGLGAFLDSEYGNTTTAAEVQLIGAVQGAEAQAIADAKAGAKAHALGGWLGPGEVGLVGEAGAEYIMGGQTGATVTPAGQRGGVSVYFQYFGPQDPTAEMEQAMMMRLSAALGGF